jgi:molecular chaperone GrpE
LIYKQLADALARQGLERIPAKGAPFDPFVHQAIERVETADAADGVVLEELQPGYKFKGMVVRPAMVRVAAAPTSADSNDPLVN